MQLMVACKWSRNTWSN